MPSSSRNIQFAEIFVCYHDRCHRADLSLIFLALKLQHFQIIFLALKLQHFVNFHSFAFIAFFSFFHCVISVRGL